jgi:hypothetical protein
MISNPIGNLQGPEEVLEAGVRGGEQRPGEHGHHRRLLHAQGHQGRRGIPQGSQIHILFYSVFYTLDTLVRFLYVSK